MPRFSRISWKRRDDAEPPRIASRIEAAKRRRSERETPGRAEADVVLLGVLALEAETGLRRLDEQRPHARLAGVRRRALVDRALDERDEPLVVDCARGRDDDVPGRVQRAVVGLDRALRDARDHLGGADHGPPERV